MTSVNGSFLVCVGSGACKGRPTHSMSTIPQSARHDSRSTTWVGSTTRVISSDSSLIRRRSMVAVRPGQLDSSSLGGLLIGTFDGPNTTFFMTDGLGSVVASFSNTAGLAAVLGNQTYEPYGKARDQQGLHRPVQRQPERAGLLRGALLRSCCWSFPLAG